MHHLEIPEKKIEVDYPSGWDEIGRRQAGPIGEIMYRCFKGEIDYDMTRKLAVDVFLNRVNKPDKPMYGEGSLNYWGNESILADSVDWMFEKGDVIEKVIRKRSLGKGGHIGPPVHLASPSGEKGDHVGSPVQYTINPKFCMQVAPYITVGKNRYAGPKDLLSDLTAYEWKEASWRVAKYSQTRDDDYLDQLFEILYIKEGVIRGDRAVTQDRPNDRPNHEAPIGIKFMNYLFFVGCMNWIREEPIEIDGAEISFGCLFPKKEVDGIASQARNDNQDNTGVAGILFQIAESGVFGNMDQVLKVNMWDIFLRLYQIHLQAKAMKI